MSIQPKLSVWSLVCLATVLCALPALAQPIGQDVYINGVKVTGGVKDVTFPKVDVRFDPSGNIYITAPGYKIEVEKPGGALPPKPNPVAAATAAQIGQMKYWTVVNVPATGHYKIDLVINGKTVAQIPETSPQFVMDMSDKLILGVNSMQVIVYPMPNAPTVPTTEAVNVIVGEGVKSADGTLEIRKVHGTVRHTTGKRSAESFPISLKL